MHGKSLHKSWSSPHRFLPWHFEYPKLLGIVVNSSLSNTITSSELNHVFVGLTLCVIVFRRCCSILKRAKDSIAVLFQEFFCQGPILFFFGCLRFSILCTLMRFRYLLASLSSIGSFSPPSIVTLAFSSCIGFPIHVEDGMYFNFLIRDAIYFKGRAGSDFFAVDHNLHIRWVSTSSGNSQLLNCVFSEFNCNSKLFLVAFLGLRWILEVTFRPLF